VSSGHVASITRCGLDVTISGASSATCTGVDSIPVTTQYRFYDGGKDSQLRLTRTFGFDENTPLFAGGSVGVRAYVPRLPRTAYTTVLYPNQGGTAVTSTTVASCPGDCLIATGTTWNGQWYADVDPATGHALIVRRDPAMTSPVNLTINYDSFSSSNLSSFVLLQPTAGWNAPITEVEYLCFADLTTWPTAERDAAVLPAWCGP
jgi:hypothetical protein